MMTETFERIKKNADEEWKFEKINIVDEFTGGSDMPPPFSLPFLLTELLGDLYRGWWLGESGAHKHDDSAMSSAKSVLDTVSDDSHGAANLKRAPDLIWLADLVESRTRTQQLQEFADNKLMDVADDVEKCFATMLENPPPPPAASSSPIRP